MGGAAHISPDRKTDRTGRHESQAYREDCLAERTCIAQERGTWDRRGIVMEVLLSYNQVKGSSL